MPPYIERIGDLIEDVEQHRRFKQSIPAFVREASLLNLTTAPVIHSLLLPLAALDIWVGERGYRFSGGERQRLAVARALLPTPWTSFSTWLTASPGR